MAKDEARKAMMAELIGTFILVFIGTATAVLAGSGLLGDGALSTLAIPFAFGFTLLVLVYSLGHVSGGHFNPAVTIAMHIAKKINTKDSINYILAQLVGGLLASIVLAGVLFGFAGYNIATFGLGANGVTPLMAESSQLMLEIILTALFVFVIFNATSAKAKADAAGWAIGGYLFVAHLIGVPLGGSSLNPARSLGPALVQQGAALSSLWIFIAGPIAGAILGYFLYKQVASK